MKKHYILKALIIFILLTPAISSSEENGYDAVVEFGDPKGDRIIQFTGNGDLNVTGYDGEKVLISSDDILFKDNDEVHEKAKGLKKIGGGGFNILNKKNNIIIISRPIHESIDLDIKVPNNTCLKFGSDIGIDSWSNGEVMDPILADVYDVNEKADPPAPPPAADIIRSTSGGVFYGILEGDVSIKDFSGTIEVNTVNGDIDAVNIEGEVIASTVDGDINVIFKELNKGSALCFSTVDGDIDITFPENIKADIMAKTIEGEVYSGFDADVIMGKSSEDETVTTGGISNFINPFHSNYITARINGGGHDVHLNTIDGDIYIRKGK